MQKARDYKQTVRSQKSQEVLDAEREARREKERNRKREQRARAAGPTGETYQDKEARLLKRREERAGSLHQQTPEEKSDPRRGAHKLEYNRNRNKEQRANETPEAREARLEKMRQYSAERRANKAMKTSSKVTEATKERMAAFRAKRTPEQIQHDKEAAREGMARLAEGHRKVAYVERAPHYHLDCRVRKWRLEVAEKGAAAGPEPLLTNGKPEYCHQCDQDLKVPVAGKGRCPCRECAVLFRKFNDYVRRTNVCLNARRERRGQETDRPKPSTSRELYAPTVDIPEDMCEYDKIRQKNIEERRRRFQEIGLREAKTTVSNALKLTKKTSFPEPSPKKGVTIVAEESESEDDPDDAFGPPDAY